MKTLLLITTLALSANAYSYCDYNDSDCIQRETEQRLQDNYRQEQAEQRFRQIEREQEEMIERYEAEAIQRERNRQRYDDHTNTSDIICHYLDTDC